MDVDPDPKGQVTPPGTPFDDEFIKSTTPGRQTADPPGSVRTENYFTPLSEEQASGEAAAAAQATSDEAEAVAAEAAAAAFIANLAMNREATEAAEAAAARALAEAAALAEAETSTRAETTATVAAAAATAAGAATGSATLGTPLTETQMAAVEAEA